MTWRPSIILLLFNDYWLCGNTMDIIDWYVTDYWPMLITFNIVYYWRNIIIDIIEINHYSRIMW